MTAIAHLSHGRRRRLAQAGLIGRGALYCLVGILAVQLALGSASSQQASQSGALQLLAQLPGGTVLALLLGIALLGYAAWRATQFLTEKRDEDSDAKSAVMRASYLVRAVIYLGFAFLSFAAAFGGASSSGGGSSQTALTAMVMRDVPGGVVLVGLVGLIIIGVGIYQSYRAYTNDFMEELCEGEMTPTERTWTERIGIAGHTARAIVYSLIGIFVLKAAIDFDPQEAQGLGGALQELSQQAFGQWILILVALGLFLYGLYAIVRARYVDVTE